MIRKVHPGICPADDPHGRRILILKYALYGNVNIRSYPAQNKFAVLLQKPLTPCLNRKGQRIPVILLLQGQGQLQILIPVELCLVGGQGIALRGFRHRHGELRAGPDGHGLDVRSLINLGLFHPELIGSGGQGQVGTLSLASRKRLLPRFPHFVCGNFGVQGHMAVILSGNRLVVSLHVRSLGGFPDGHGEGSACQLVSIETGRYLVGVNADIHRLLQLIDFVLPHFFFASILHPVPPIAHLLVFRSRRQQPGLEAEVLFLPAVNRGETSGMLGIPKLADDLYTGKGGGGHTDVAQILLVIIVSIILIHLHLVWIGVILCIPERFPGSQHVLEVGKGHVPVLFEFAELGGFPRRNCPIAAAGKGIPGKVSINLELFDVTAGDIQLALIILIDVPMVAAGDMQRSIHIGPLCAASLKLRGAAGLDS